MTDDTVTLLIDGVSWASWENVRITRGIERMPSDFALTVTERYPNSAETISILPGQDVVLKVGADVLLTGYIDRYNATIDAGGHTVGIVGRGKCQDLVDCSAEFTGQQIMQSDALGIAKIVSRQFGIDVSCNETNLRPIFAFQTILTETGFSVIERVTRYSGLLAYEGRDGNLVLSRAGTRHAASGFSQGTNVQSAHVSFSMDQRFSEVTVLTPFNDWQTDPNHTVIGLSTGNGIYTEQDPGVLRKRPHAVVSEQTDAAFATAELRAKWEVARRYGRSQVVTLTCDSWRDSDGELWEPNTLATVDIPSLKLNNRTWLIADVTFSKDASRGTTAEITLMPRGAFSIEPILLVPFDAQLAADIAGRTFETSAGAGPG